MAAPEIFGRYRQEHFVDICLYIYYIYIYIYILEDAGACMVKYDGATVYNSKRSDGSGCYIIIVHWLFLVCYENDVEGYI